MSGLGSDHMAGLVGSKGGPECRRPVGMEYFIEILLTPTGTIQVGCYTES